MRDVRVWPYLMQDAFSRGLRMVCTSFAMSGFSRARDSSFCHHHKHHCQPANCSIEPDDSKELADDSKEPGGASSPNHHKYHCQPQTQDSFATPGSSRARDSSVCRHQGSGCRVQGAGFRVQGAEFRVQG